MRKNNNTKEKKKKGEIMILEKMETKKKKIIRPSQKVGYAMKSVIPVSSTTPTNLVHLQRLRTIIPNRIGAANNMKNMELPHSCFFAVQDSRR